MKRKRPEARRPGGSGAGPGVGGGARGAPPARARLAPPPAPLPEDAARRAAAALVAVLVALTLARAAFAFVPSMAWWGLGVLRFVPPLPGWALWAVAAAALVPAIAGRAAPWLERAGEWLARAPVAASAAAALALAAAVLAASDQVQVVGDYLMRLGTARGQFPPGAVFPQALPLDLYLHHSLPQALAASFAIDANDSARYLGALEAALLAMLAVAFARALRLRGAAAVATVAAVALTGALGLFTGFSKAFSELCVVTAAVGAFGIAAVTSGGGLLGLSLATSAGFALHRSAVALIPALAVVWALWIRDHGRAGEWKRPVHLVAFALPPLTLGFMLPRIRAAIAGIDRVHVAREGADAAHVLGAAFRPRHLLDLANLLLELAPLAAAALVLAPLLLPSLRRRAEGLVLLALVVPFLALMLFVHPRQGLFRDWDVFAPGVVAVSLVAAWLVGETLRGAPGRAWLAAGVVAAALVPAAHWLVHHHDANRGLARIEAYLAGPPRRADEERALLLAFLGVRYQAVGRLDAGADAYRRAAELAPSPRILFEWALAESERGDDRKAQSLLARVVAAQPDMIPAWLGLAIASYQVGDTAACRRAALRALELQPNLERARDLLRSIAPRESTHVPRAR